MTVLVLALAAAAVLTRLAVAAVRIARLTPAARRNYPAVLWSRIRWPWLMRNCHLAYIDHYHRRIWPRLPGTTGVRVSPVQRHKLRYPAARFRADDFGLVATVRTVPNVGRAEFDKQAPHIADAWRCVRVQVAQPRPGRLIVRGLRTDPLSLPLPADQAPPGVYGAGAVQHPLRLYLGLDEWGDHRWITLPGLTGITVGGLPGYGKTELVKSWLMQLAGLPVAFVLIDGKGGGDYADWSGRAWIVTGDELPAAAAAFEDTHGLMRSRLARAGDGGPRNRWHVGPTVDWPLVVTVIDECHTFFDLDAVKGQREAEAHVRACRALTGQLVRKGRTPLFLTILITQKQTSDAIPTAIRDNCGLGLSFAVKTRDAAVAALGEHIRDYPSFCPTSLQSSEYVGVATTSLRTGHDPFVRIRCPEISEAAARERARATARIDPTSSPVAVPPLTVGQPEPVSA